MRLGVTDHIDCAHVLPGHPKCGRLHGHTYRIEVEIDGPAEGGGMVLDFADLKAQVRTVLGRFDHRHWNDFLELPTVENICAHLASELAGTLAFPFAIRVFEGHGKWAATSGEPTSSPGGRER